MLTIMHSLLIPSVARAMGSLAAKGKNCHLLAAVSGGADSTALLCALKQLQANDGFLLSCVHVNHGLRGNESEGDAAFVQSLCQQWQVPCHVIKLNHLALHQPGLETQAREARYEAIHAVYDQIGADALLLAHHRGDQAETVLMHWLRGSGLKGLCGIAPTSHRQGMRLIRPFLDIPAAQLRDALQELHQPWREDATNQIPDNPRNRIRLEIAPQLEALSPGYEERIARSCHSLARVQDYLEASARPLLEQPGLIPLNAFAAVHPAVQDEVLRRFAPGMSYEQTEALRQLALGSVGRAMPLPDGGEAYRGHRFLHRLPSEFFDYEALIIRRVLNPGDAPGDGRQAQDIPEKLAQQAVIRTRQPGDWIHPFGSKGSKSLQDYLVDRKIDQPFRDVMPLLAHGQEILWVPGVGASQSCLLAPGESAVMFSLASPLPWQLTE